MHTHTIEGRALAIVAGALFALGTLGILLEDVILHDAPMTLKHWITVVVIAGTIMVGHQVHKAWHSGVRLSAAGFAGLFLVGTMLTGYSSVGRQAEHTMIASAQVEADAAARTRATKGLSEAEAMLAERQRKLAKECATGKGKRCDGIAATVSVYEAAVKGHKAELQRLGPARVAVPEAKRAGELAAVFGADPAKIEAAAILVVPFLTTVFLELGAIICLGYGFRPVRRALNDNAPAVEAEPLPPATALPPALVGAEIIPWAQSFERKHGRKPRLDEIRQAFPEVSKATAWRRVQAA